MPGPTNTSIQPLFSSFNSAYRLTLRALSASVRHHPSATRNLRSLYRPTFREAATVLQRYNENRSVEDRTWLREWNDRLDRTLAFLYSSATTAGRPGHLVKNLAFLTDAYHTRAWLDTTARLRQAGEWDSQLGANSSHSRPQKVGQGPKDRVQLSAWSAVGELAKATENDLRILTSYQEQRKLPFTRLTMSQPASPKKKHRIFMKLVGKAKVRPSDLKH